MNRLFFLSLVFIAACGKGGYNTPDPVPAKELAIKAADASFLPELRTYGIATKNRSGQAEDMLTTLE